MNQARAARPHLSADEVFAAIAESYAKSGAGVERVVLFGYDCLRAGGKVFAKVDRGSLVLKLGAGRVAALAGSDQLHPYAHGAGRKMKDWAAVTTDDKGAVIRLAEEARLFATK